MAFRANKKNKKTQSTGSIGAALEQKYMNRGRNYDPYAAAAEAEKKRKANMSASEKAGLAKDFTGTNQKGAQVTMYKGGKESGTRLAGTQKLGTNYAGSVWKDKWNPQYEGIQGTVSGGYRQEKGRWGRPGRMTNEVTGVSGAAQDVGREFRTLRGLSQAPVELSEAGKKTQEALARKQDEIDRGVASSTETALARMRRGGSRGGGSRERLLGRLGEAGLQQKEDLATKGLELEAMDLGTTQAFKRDLQKGMPQAALLQQKAFGDLASQQRQTAEMLRPDINWQRQAYAQDIQSGNQAELAKMQMDAANRAGNRARSAGMMAGMGTIIGGLAGGPLGATIGGAAGRMLG